MDRDNKSTGSGEWFQQAERSRDEAKRNPGRSAGSGAGTPDSTLFHPGYRVFLLKDAPQV
ncbi:MAG: hypothetical protein HY268_22295 [Deltaproteobacteria bacterium]|nr:hypothetical protein [Deltaproteobacteria bacterium]